MTFFERMWAYITLGAMGIIVEEASPLMGGVAARDRHLRLTTVIAAVALGTWLAGIGLYMLGRWRGRWVRKRWPRFRKGVLRSVALVRRHPWRASLAVRFAWGLRLVLPLACGVSRIPPSTYLTGTAVSCVVWSLMFTVLGWWVGETAAVLVRDMRRAEPLIAGALVLAMVVGFIVVRRRHVPEKTAKVLDQDVPGSG